MMVTVEDRRSGSAEVTVEMLEAYVLRLGWAPAYSGSRTFRSGDGAMVWLPHDLGPHTLAAFIEVLATSHRRQPSEVLSDIVGYQVGLDRGRASVLRNSASAHVVEAREVLARVKPRDAAGHERARVRLEQAEAELAAATMALEAAKAAGART